MATIAENLETIDTAISTMKTNLNLSSDASLSDVVTATAGGGGGVDLDDYFETNISGATTATNGIRTTVKSIKRFKSPLTASTTNLDFTFNQLTSLIEAPQISNMTSVTSLNNTFANCSSLVTAPSWNTVNVTDFSSMFNNCSALVNVPVYDLSSATNLTNMFNGCYDLSSTSLDNVLQSCISATSYTGTKTLTTLAFTAARTPAATIQALPHYSDFIAAGWSIGY